MESKNLTTITESCVEARVRYESRRKDRSSFSRNKKYLFDFSLQVRVKLAVNPSIIIVYGSFSRLFWIVYLPCVNCRIFGLVVQICVYFLRVISEKRVLSCAAIKIETISFVGLGKTLDQPFT